MTNQLTISDLKTKSLQNNKIIRNLISYNHKFQKLNENQKQLLENISNLKNLYEQYSKEVISDFTKSKEKFISNIISKANVKSITKFEIGRIEFIK